MKPFVTGLEAFGYSTSDIKNIHKPAQITILLRYPDPKQYQKVPQRNLQIKNYFSDLNQEIIKKYQLKDVENLDFDSIQTWIEPKFLEKISRDKNIHHILVKKIKGVRVKKSKILKNTSWAWYTVKALIAVQIENQTRGPQSHEERFVVVKARSEKEAAQKFKRHQLRNEEMYFNFKLQIVRWHLIKILDVYELYGITFPDQNSMTEIFSSISEGKVTPETAWIIK